MKRNLMLRRILSVCGAILLTAVVVASLLVPATATAAPIGAGLPRPIDVQGEFLSDNNTSIITNVVQCPFTDPVLVFFVCTQFGQPVGPNNPANDPDPNWIATRTIEGDISGSFDGPLFVIESVVTHYTGGRVGAFTFKATQLCEDCKVWISETEYLEGSFTMTLQGTGQDQCTEGDRFTGQWSIIGKGEGELEKLNGHGTVVAPCAGLPSGATGAYEGSITIPGLAKNASTKSVSSADGAIFSFDGASMFLPLISN